VFRQAPLGFQTRGVTPVLMKLRERLEPQNYEQRLQAVRKERSAETKQVERLFAVLVKKANFAKAKGIPNRAA
jgi:hypothetical protein